jgi:septum formation protein
LLEEAGIDFLIVPSNTTEEVRPEETPEAYALRVAQEKAQEVAQRFPGQWVLGADTIVTLDGLILGKPKDEDDSFRMLRFLSGRTHRVMTAFVLLDATGAIHTGQVVVSNVTFHTLSDEQLRAYIATGEPQDKAGAYAIQGLGAAFVAQVEGSYANVVGLPIDEVLRALQAAGLGPTHEASSS